MGLNDEMILTWGVAAALLLLAIVMVRPALRHRLQRRREERLINSLGVDQIRDVIIDDGMEGSVVLERLLLTPEGMLVLMTLRRQGNLFGGDRIDTWVQVMGKRTIRFPNPFYTLETLLAAVRYHAPGIKVQSRVLFLGDCAFPKGKPEGAWTLADIPEQQGKQISAAVLPVMQQKWDALKAHAARINPKT
ncbi:MAG TPA: nuclease-related domain-containing protein, partial [Gammaproteobacteria bacterium]